ncbi:hypothetical protein [Streptomyces sp. NBC_00198]|uniref:hypothetical protein n=1 Tax=Streptomyces sp. NBC_00198 TaxID=2975677 RepID=UPI00224EDA22|nr:hypothetical protein [Streptomyces sp. NBC_00198]MCX5286230.1 hypothetical protein [Streptomyces sp. NBC_00198]
MRTNALALTACTAVLLTALVGCSSGDGGDTAAKPKATETAGDPVAYLYDVDDHRKPRADVQALVEQLRTRCTDDALGLEFTATNKALDLVDAQHDHQDVYPVLAQLAADLPKGHAKQHCAPRLGAAVQRLKGQRA